MNFKELREKSVKGIHLKRYLIDPTPNEVVGFLRNISSESLRFLLHDEKMYFWDAWYMTHQAFIEQELLAEWEFDRVDNRGNIEFEDNVEGTMIGETIEEERYQYIWDIFHAFEKEYDGVFRGTGYDHPEQISYKFVKNKESIQEKTMMGKSIRYFVDPVGSQMAKYLDNSSYGSVRMLIYEGTLYMWEAAQQTHAGFITDELSVHLKDYSELAGMSLHLMLNEGSPTLTVGKRLMKERKGDITNFMNILETKYNGRFDESRGVSTEEFIYGFWRNEE